MRVRGRPSSHAFQRLQVPRPTYPPGGFNYVTDGFDYYSLTNDWNAAEAMWSVCLGFTQNPDYQTLKEDYDYLPALLRKGLQEKGSREWQSYHQTNSAVTKMDRDKNDIFVVTIKDSEPLLAHSVTDNTDSSRTRLV